MFRRGCMVLLVLIMMWGCSPAQHITQEVAEKIALEQAEKELPVTQLQISSSKRTIFSEAGKEGRDAWEIVVTTPRDAPQPVAIYYIDSTSGKIISQTNSGTPR